ncbi:MAG: heme-binding domain-containing protein [Acidobacteriota bacterium]|nr:heme-binding domain-containing protein [Acidobacteriota bacterium]
MKKYLKWAAIVIALTFVGIQFIRPARTNPPIDETQTIQAKLNVSPEIDAILARSCNDCHSNRTNWVWYSNIAPGSWLMSFHVEEGRRELNFSEWGNLSRGRASRKLEEICEQVNAGEMPIWNYVLLHPSAHLTDDDKKILCDWTKQEQEKIDANLPKAQS